MGFLLGYIWGSDSKEGGTGGGGILLILIEIALYMSFKEWIINTFTSKFNILVALYILTTIMIYLFSYGKDIMPTRELMYHICKVVGTIISIMISIIFFNQHQTPFEMFYNFTNCSYWGNVFGTALAVILELLHFGTKILGFLVIQRLIVGILVIMIRGRVKNG
ncbi:MAG: hypothetical protein ACLS2V_12675 [Clostridium paraputrificum]|uniref:hypothetical protein n=1 Tax=Clostridium sp. TaxID=1506 RepID=UPI0025BFFF4B|nr:hypothetical protein [Clostridium sp.]MBS5926142.1 hypothetical protein [Clostridium sp.]